VMHRVAEHPHDGGGAADGGLAAHGAQTVGTGTVRQPHLAPCRAGC
jgi:hypothetical protein